MSNRYVENINFKEIKRYPIYISSKIPFINYIFETIYINSFYVNCSNGYVIDSFYQKVPRYNIFLPCEDTDYILTFHTNKRNWEAFSNVNPMNVDDVIRNSDCEPMKISISKFLKVLRESDYINKYVRMHHRVEEGYTFSFMFENREEWDKYINIFKLRYKLENDGGSTNDYVHIISGEDIRKVYNNRSIRSCMTERDYLVDMYVKEPNISMVIVVSRKVEDISEYLNNLNNPIINRAIIFETNRGAKYCSTVYGDYVFANYIINSFLPSNNVFYLKSLVMLSYKDMKIKLQNKYKFYPFMDHFHFLDRFNNELVYSKGKSIFGNIRYKKLRSIDI